VARPELCQPLAQVLQQLGARRVMVVSGNAGSGFLDEFSTVKNTTIAEYYHDRGFHSSEMDSAHFGFQAATIEDLRGGDRKQNALILREILAGKERGPKRDAVLLNAAAALFVAGQAKSLTEGVEQVADLIGNGKALAKLDELAKYRP
jgi:anthranilate phosphoribosyltransferase